jgi:hypothetical protein
VNTLFHFEKRFYCCDPLKDHLGLTLLYFFCQEVLEGKKAVGVEVIRFGRKRRILARREGILSAGAIGSPVILQLSGVGPKEHLQKLNVSKVNSFFFSFLFVFFDVGVLYMY